MEIKGWEGFSRERDLRLKVIEHFLSVAYKNEKNKEYCNYLIKNCA